MPTRWDGPRRSAEAECARRGRQSFVAGCVSLLEGRQVDDDLVRAIGGPPADYVLAGGEGGRDGYWPRVWAARGLLHVWDVGATDALVKAASDESWRVREMAAKIVARHVVDEALDAVAELQRDHVTRVRVAAARALRVLTNQDR